MEENIAYEEVLLCLKKMKNHKSPGPDGFSSEFYKYFWKDIGHFLITSFNYAFKNGHLSITQKQGIVTILPKGDKWVLKCI